MKWVVGGHKIKGGGGGLKNSLEGATIERRSGESVFTTREASSIQKKGTNCARKGKGKKIQ